jgi:hypothetical protein
MKIVMISGHGCIRMLKQAIVLIEKGHEVHLICNKLPSFREQFKTFHLCSDTEQMLDCLRLFVKAGDVDIFHAHNEPSWYVTALKEMTDKPVILDVHDSYLARTTPDEADELRAKGIWCLREMTEERTNFQLADALIFPGDHFRQVIVPEYKLSQPALTLPSYVPKRFYQYQTMQWLGGLVYEGKVNLPAEAQGMAQGFNYCDYTDLSAKANELGIDFHIYAGRDKAEFLGHYDKAHTFVHEPLTFETLINKISGHDWGLVGNLNHTREWEVAMPNKLFEYMAACVPIVAINANGCSDFIEQEGIGITVSSLEELASRWAEHRWCRERLIKVRQNWSMNAQICHLENFYSEVLNHAGNRNCLLESRSNAG